VIRYILTQRYYTSSYGNMLTEYNTMRWKWVGGARWWLSPDMSKSRNGGEDRAKNEWKSTPEMSTIVRANDIVVMDEWKSVTELWRNCRTLSR
jgi:hypothetical protein